MRKRFFIDLAIGILILGIAGMTHADFIVNTGTNGGGTQHVLSASQWWAGEFEIFQDYTITSVEGYIQGANTGTITAAIYTDGGTIPGLEKYSAQFSHVPFSQWEGASSLSWFLKAGTYWVSFEVRQGDTFLGVFPGSAINPLNNYAVTSNSIWLPMLNTNAMSGIRISSAPEPATMLLLGFGLVGLAGLRRKIKK